MNRLKQLRTARKMSLRSLSEQTGIEFSSIAYYERGERNFSVKSQQVLSDFFGVSVDYLLGKSPEDMFNDFVDSLRNDFMVETAYSDGDVTQSLSPAVPEPVRTKIEILRLLRGIDSKTSLDMILEFAKMRTAHDDFSKPVGDDE